jgi:molybdopterin synthase catalytic subunit
MIRISVGEEIDIRKEVEYVKDAEAGAVVTFLGTVRREKGRVKEIAYEGYPGMTEKSLRSIADEAQSLFGLINVIIAHRTGVIPAGGDVVFIAVSASHRRAAFESCSWIMDRIKEIVPIWKEIINE